MALQTQNLVMLGLGIQGDSPPNPFQPPLVDGIHLRWAFKQELGFPWYGFYLFRRLHRAGDPICLVAAATNTLPTGKTSDKTLNTPFGYFHSNENLVITNDFPPRRAKEIDLDNRGFLRFALTPDNVARKIEVRIGFREKAKAEITALYKRTPVAQTTVAGNAGQVLTVILEFDAITNVKISSAPAALVELCFVPVSQEATEGWESVPDFQYPMCLPVKHPDYPCSPGASEDLSQARNSAKQRIRYGSPDPFTSPQGPPFTAGKISVVNGSPIIMGTGTNWKNEHVGQVLQVSGDSTAYTITMVVAPDKLVLSRSYVGVSGTGKTYEIYEEAFGQLHDYLVHLVAGGSATGPMVSRSIPVAVDSDGTIKVTYGSAEVTGIGTSWGSDLVGLTLQVAEVTAGTISVNNGSRTVTGSGTSWSSDLAGLTLKVVGERAEYTILTVDSTTQLRLDRSYDGPTDGGKAYTIFDKTPYTILSIDSPTQLTLDRCYGRATEEFGSVKAYAIFAALQPTEPGSAAPRIR
ncbi:MAG: hypothetical protein ACE5IY_16705, partial [bacterium]